MSLAREIIDNTTTTDDFHKTELYSYIKDIIPNILEGINKLLSDDDNSMLIDNVNKLCTVLNGNGFTYYPENTDYLSVKDIKQLLRNYKEFYETYLDEFSVDQLEILNTNSKDLFTLLERVK